MTQTATSKSSHLAQVRDSVESVYVAIVLAFVLRAFMIEAFVIPTGSMANALYGDHFELTCPSCGWKYAFGRDQTNTPNAARCPNCFCRYGSVSHPATKFYSGGDRVLVMKYLYDFSPLQPWDVVVFKNPQNNRENYIKRLIGLPGEGIRIIQGDIFVSQDEGTSWHIRRKPPQAQQDMWQVVHNGDYPPFPALVASCNAHSPRWYVPDPETTPWNLKEYDGRVFTFRGAERAETIRFDPGRGEDLIFGDFLPFNGYNELRNLRRDPPMGYDPQTDICTDWRLSCVWRVESTTPAVMNIIFASFEDRYRATFQTDGTVRLLHQRRNADSNDWQEWGRTDVGPFTPQKGRSIALLNVDYRASVWVDEKCVIESTDAQYAGPLDEGVSPAEGVYNKALKRAEKMLEFKQRNNGRGGQTQYDPNDEKLETWYKTPEIRISAQGGAFSLWHINLQRDVFYTQSFMYNPQESCSKEHASESPIFDYFRQLYQLQLAEKEPERFKPYQDEDKENTSKQPMGDMKSWGSLKNPIYLKNYPGRDDLDEFFCMGDNSAQSHDGRSWNAAAPSLRLFDEAGRPIYQLGTVPRYNIIGRAMLVYWPAGFRVPFLDWPIVPNVGRIRLIR